ncbi:MAG TPA: 50S ribosomal protein L23 [Candidatus Moranbacteria bacterium]|nr:50S ribosomal protein L23 [Candidatus Moranbacteria bacterium]
MVKDNKKSENNSIAYRVLMEPWITEAATMMVENNKYVFKVAPKATKGEIKKSIEDLYGVNVAAINTVNIPRKKRIRGRSLGFKSGFKKAIVTLKEGDKIDIFEK